MLMVGFVPMPCGLTQKVVWCDDIQCQARNRKDNMNKTHKSMNHATATKRLFRGDYGRLYQIGSRGTMRVEDLIRVASSKMHKPARLIAFDLIVLRNPKHRSNGGKSMNIARRPGYIRLAPARKAA